MTPSETARAAVANGISVVPPRDNGTKRPIGTWKEYQQRLPTGDELDRWYANPDTGIGIVCGHVSGNLEMLEFEGRAIRDGLYADFSELVHAAGLADLWQRIEDGYWERTPTGGYHFLYRSEHVEGNTKLAAEETGEVLIETRGEGGYVITAPTAGNVHPTGRPWEIIAGSIDTIPTITRTERAAIHRTARALDRSPSRVLSEPKEHYEHTQQDRPGDRYNHHGDAPARTLSLLLEHGWKLAFTDRYGVHHLTRPGKDPREGTSATLGSPKVGGGFYVFSTSAHPFEAERGYDHYAVYTHLRHGGDWSASAKDLAGQGFTEPDPGLELKLPGNSTADPVEFRISPGSIIFEIDLNPTPLWGENEEILWAQGEPLLVYGPTGVGKTTIAHRILLALIGVGEPTCLGYPISPLPPDQTVLYIAADRPRQAMRSLRRMVDPDIHSQILRYRLAIEHYRQLWAGEDDKEMLLRAARQVNAGAIFIDSSKDLAAGPLKDEGPAKGLMDGVQVAIANGIEVAMLHHPRKITQDRATKDLSIDDVYGSAWITAGVGSVLLVNGDVGSGVVQVSQLKAPATFIQPLEASINYQNGVIVAATKFGVLEWMRLHGDRKKTSEIAQFMNELAAEDRPTDGQRKAAERLLHDLVVGGELTREKQGNGWIYWVPPEVRLGGM